VTYSRDVYEHDRVMTPSWCQHRLLSVVPIVAVRIEGGYAARCLLCGAVGPVRDNRETAQRELLDRGVRDEG
jgi:hypothetical protein